MAATLGSLKQGSFTDSVLKAFSSAKGHVQNKASTYRAAGVSAAEALEGGFDKGGAAMFAHMPGLSSSMVGGAGGAFAGGVAGGFSDDGSILGGAFKGGMMGGALGAAGYAGIKGYKGMKSAQAGRAKAGTMMMADNASIPSGAPPLSGTHDMGAGYAGASSFGPGFSAPVATPKRQQGMKSQKRKGKGKG